VIDAHVHLANLNLKYTGARPARNWSIADYTEDARNSALTQSTAIVMVCLTEAAGQTAAMLAQARWVQSLEAAKG
jgi:predicted TIM-barrel fold metal-dependent hydrolase